MPSLPDLRMNDGHTIPAIGFGTWKMPRGDVAHSIRAALGAGYRLVDGAALYGNEVEVGHAITQDPEVPREDIVLTTKIWNDRQGREESRIAFEESASRLNAGVIDLLLIHWPVPSLDLFVDTWRTFIELREEGRVRSIGVSNFGVAHLERLIGETGVVPAVNQVELHPFLPQRELQQYHAEHGIVTEAWSPLHQGTRLLLDSRIRQIAERNSMTPAQAVLVWHLAQGIVALPKSVTPARVRENYEAIGLSLPGEDLAAIDAMADGLRRGQNPDEM
nr:aldo/keto reductase [Actinomycetales bacterium]